jgi:hypothetical protein
MLRDVIPPNLENIDRHQYEMQTAFVDAALVRVDRILDDYDNLTMGGKSMAYWDVFFKESE